MLFSFLTSQLSANCRTCELGSFAFICSRKGSLCGVSKRVEVFSHIFSIIVCCGGDGSKRLPACGVDKDGYVGRLLSFLFVVRLSAFLLPAVVCMMSVEESLKPVLDVGDETSMKKKGGRRQKFWSILKPLKDRPDVGAMLLSPRRGLRKGYDNAETGKGTNFARVKSDEGPAMSYDENLHELQTVRSDDGDTRRCRKEKCMDVPSPRSGTPVQIQPYVPYVEEDDDEDDFAAEEECDEGSMASMSDTEGQVGGHLPTAEHSEFFKASHPPLCLKPLGKDMRLDVILLGQNAVRVEIDTLFKIVTRLDTRGSSITKGDIRNLKKWAAGFISFVQKFFEFEDTELYPLLEANGKNSLTGNMDLKKRKLVRDCFKTYAQEFGDWTARADSAPVGDIVGNFCLLRTPVDKIALLLFGYFDRQQKALLPEIGLRLNDEELETFPARTLKAFSSNPDKKTHSTLLLSWMTGEDAEWRNRVFPASKISQIQSWGSSDEHVKRAKLLTS